MRDVERGWGKQCCAVATVLRNRLVRPRHPACPRPRHCTRAPPPCRVAPQLMMDATATLIATHKALEDAVAEAEAAKAAAALDAPSSGPATDGPAVDAPPLPASGSLSDGEESEEELDPGVALGGVLTWPANACLNVQVDRGDVAVPGRCVGIGAAGLCSAWGLAVHVYTSRLLCGAVDVPWL